MPGDLHLIARQLGKDLFHPAFTAENPRFAGDDHRMRLRFFWQQQGSDVVIGVNIASQIFTQGVCDTCRNIQINTFQKCVTSLVGVVAARRHDKTPNW
jgi:hypothetical protein